MGRRLGENLARTADPAEQRDIIPHQEYGDTLSSKSWGEDEWEMLQVPVFVFLGQLEVLPSWRWLPAHGKK